MYSTVYDDGKFKYVFFIFLLDFWGKHIMNSL